jgi:hypothetical protein
MGTASLSRTTGPVLDPVFSFRRRIHLPAGMTLRVAFIAGAADTREQVMAIAQQFKDFQAIDRAFAEARAESHKEFQEWALTTDDVDRFHRLMGAPAAAVGPGTPARRAGPYHLGIDQGPVVLMIENYRTGLIWNIMRRCPRVVAGLRRAGFTGGWL